MSNQFNHDLIERYIYAVTRQLPYKIREDISKELQSLIDDMLLERCHGKLPTQTDLNLVLTELGKPEDLARNYNPDQDKYLISPKYYGIYKSLLSIVLASTALGMTIAGFLNIIFSQNPISLPLEILKWMGTSIMGLIYPFAFITILVAIFERKGIFVDLNFSDFQDLPKVPREQEKIRKFDCVFEITFSILFAVLFLFTPNAIRVFTHLPKSSGMSSIPVFQAEVIHNMWFLIVLFFLISITKSTFRLYEGRYTKRLAVFTVFSGVISLICAYLFTQAKEIMNPDFTNYITDIFSKTSDAAFIINTFTHLNTVFLAIIAFAIFLDILNVVIRAVIYDK